MDNLQHSKPSLGLGHTIHTFDSLPSTNDKAKALLAEAAAHGTVVVADMQTAGRGRRGHTWHSARRLGLYMSMIINPGAGYTAALLPVAAALSVYDALAQFCGPGVAAIKWPNDVLLAGKKAVGILIEMTAGPQGLAGVVGIGINVNGQDFPPDIADKATSMALVSGHSYDKEQVLQAVLAAFDQRLAQAQHSPQTLLHHYRQACVTLGRPVTVHTDTGSYPAQALDITDTGELLVATREGKQQVLSSGDVSIRPI